MINSYKQLTGKYLKANKKRTMLTIIGIILSVSLISSIGLFLKGMQDIQIEDIKNSEGSYHLVFTKTNEDLISKITNNPKVSRSGLFSMGDEIKIGEKLVINEMVATNQALELLPYRIRNGKLPQNKQEVAVEKWVLRNIDKDAKVGSDIKIKEKVYTLSGILEDNINNQIDNKGVILSINNNMDKENKVLLVEISPKTNLKSALAELKNLGDKGTVMENTYLLMFLGEGLDDSGVMGLYFTIAIIIGIVVIATIAVIYNAFQISVVERIKQFGLLRAIGITPKQIRKIVLKEATLLAAIGVPIGLLFGVIAIYGINIAFEIIGRDSIKIMKPSVSPTILGISASVGVVAIYISAWLPAFFAGRISPLVAISSRTSIKKEKIKRKKTILGKVFGFEGTLAAKNMKRNRKRYMITVFSIVISVVLFITFTSFMDMTLNISPDLSETQNVAFSVVRDGIATEKNLTIDEKIIDDIKGIKTVDKLYKVYKPYYFKGAIDKKSELKEIKDIGNIYNSINFEGEEKTHITSSIAIYDENALEISKKYLLSGNIDVEKMNEENGVILINKNRIWNQKTNKTYYGPIANMKVGDEIYLQYRDSSKDEVEFGKKDINKVKVMAILKNDPFNFRGNDNDLKIITTKELASKLIENDNIKPINLNITIKDLKNEEIAKTQIEEAIESNTSLMLINRIDNNRQEKSFMLMIKILIYGFVVVISLIGSVNIINTLTTNIILRKREFSVLKSIGLTQKGLKKMIVLEGIYYGIIGTIYGSIIGCGLSFLMFKGLGDVREFGFRIPFRAIVIAGTFSIGIGYLSVLAPLRRIKKGNLIEAVREEY